MLDQKENIPHDLEEDLISTKDYDIGSKPGSCTARAKDVTQPDQDTRSISLKSQDSLCDNIKKSTDIANRSVLQPVVASNN